MSDKAEEDWKRYKRAAHAMQSGVALQITRTPEAAAIGDKHLRVGVNSAMVDSGALVRLLISKGLITEDEYLEKLADQMEEEVERYEDELKLPRGSLA